MNKEVMFSSATDNWATPQNFFDKLNAEFHFDLDVCADESNHKCDTYYTKEQDGLAMPWNGKELCGVIHLMAERLGRGCAGHYLPLLAVPPSLCFSQQELIPNGFTTIFIKEIMWKCGLLGEGLNLVIAKILPHSRLWWWFSSRNNAGM